MNLNRINCRILKKCIQYNTLVAANYATTVKPNKSVDNVKAKEFTVSKDIRNYFQEHNKFDLMHMMPEKILKKKLKSPESFYLIDDATGKQIVNSLQKYLFKGGGSEKKFLIEVNPGLAIVTHQLLKHSNKIDKLILYETFDHFIKELQDLGCKHHKHIVLRKGDFVGLWKLAYQDKIDNGTRVNDFLQGIPKSGWNDEPNVQVIANVGSINLIKHLINSVVFQSSLVSFGRPEFFFILPPPLYIHLTCTNDLGYMFYRGITMLFQIMFDYEFITRLPREHFFPWQQEYNLKKNMKLRRITSVDPEYLYLVRMTPRKNLFDLCEPQNMPALWYFIKQHCVSRKLRIIPALERWIPGCGPRLISQSVQRQIKPGQKLRNRLVLPQYTIPCQEISKTDFYPNLNIFTEFGDLSPNQMLSLFDTFMNWPEFRECSFLSSMESTLLKMETSEDSTTDGLEIPDEDDVETTTTTTEAKKQTKI